MSQELSKIFSIKGRVIIVTGAAGLLGKKHAEIIAAYGGHPVLLDIEKNKVEVIAAELNKKYLVRASAFSVDITDESQVYENAKVVINLYGKIDGLVNNAAINPKVENSSEINFSRLENFSLDDWQRDINVGLTGSFLCAKHYGYLISKNPNGGSIINISSDLGVIAPDQRLYEKDGLSEELQPVKPVSYSVIKSGIIGLTRYLSTYWANKNVRCNAMCPGGVENGQTKEFLSKVESRIPLNRMAEADEYQGTLIWILSDASSYLNGAIIPIDGGRSVW
ncbi:SDR family oxidoreductase [Candidatus Thioglobus sp.]|nr:SDR family oxidoreductase [Candidatus Thioglobus sp.]